MSLFQNAVLNKYLQGLESEKVAEAYERFTSHFHNPIIQENIRNSKEEQYQGEFLIDLFVNVLGYIKNPTPNFNLTTELKNIKGSKKTDGAILSTEHDSMGKALAVIELKGTNTTDLSKIETQAFGYKNNQPGCNYVITSNYEKLRFYIDNAVDFEEFNLFQLSKERFELLWLCLSAEYLLKDIPKKIKDESLSQEELITKKLYKDYALFRNEIFDAIQKENTAYDKLTLFKKTQKLLDRFLFIFFAEDRLLLPPNSIRAILKQWTDLRDTYDEYFPLYDRFKKYFGYMNTGHKGQQHDIFAYNGGLFAPDEILDTIKINDDLLYKHTLNLSNYDFESEVSVNILGHIFEHSLNDIDEIQAEIQGVSTEQSKSKRKKDGVFYTPKYITKYIVDNTVGKLCEEKKAELDIQEADYEKGRKGRQKATLKGLTQKLEDYRKWLLQITICDPACGSGAFLNQALEFLIAEHRYIDELQAKLFGDAMILSEVENAILENNIYGVDINEESVDIAKLSLWLRTAQKGRKLTSLNNNIKCGNSLIDDPSVAGDKAFHWQKEFPDIFTEKNKKAFHITTALHDSRTSQRMIDHKVREHRDLGTNPLPNYTKLLTEEEVIITKEIIAIAEEDALKIMAYNVCGDHIHLLLVCEEEAVPKIMQKIKAKTARAVNITRGITIPREHAPLPHTTSLPDATALPTDADNTTATREHAPLPLHAPLHHTAKRGEKQHSLWTQKFGSSEIKDDTYLYNAISYIQTNRQKHKLPPHKELDALLKNPLLNQSYDLAFAPEYHGGFDVVIGNPPYVRVQNLDKNSVVFFEKNYKSATGKFDIYVLFNELSINLLKENGLLSFIQPHRFINADFGKGLKEVFETTQYLNKIISFSDIDIFQGATTYTGIFFLEKKLTDSILYKEYRNKKPIYISENLDFLRDDDFIKVSYKSIKNNWEFKNVAEQTLLKKLRSFKTLSDITLNISQGVIPGSDKIYYLEVIEEKADKVLVKNQLDENKFLIEKKITRGIIKGNNIKRYASPTSDYVIIYPYILSDNDQKLLSLQELEQNYPLTFNYLLKHKEFLINLREKYKTNPSEWYGFHRAREMKFLETDKLITSHTSISPSFTYSTGSNYFNQNVYGIEIKKEISLIQTLGVLNSKLSDFFIRNTSSMINGGYYLYKTDYLSNLPIITKENNQLILLTTNALELNSTLSNYNEKFLKYLSQSYRIDKFSKMLENWNELDFGEFIRELNNAIKKIGGDKLSKLDEIEWMDLFENKQIEIQKLKSEIQKTDQEIDQMVYELYGLTAEEITIVEEATQ